MAEATVVDYVGTVSSMEEGRNDWYKISIAVPGKSYPVKVDTKRQALIDEARRVKNEGIVCTFKVSEEDSGNENPNRPGTNFVNRRLEAITEGASSGAATGALQQQATAGGKEGLSKEEWAAKDAAADKRACIAIAAGALTHTMPSDPSTEDLNKFTERVIHLASGWYRVVHSTRSDPEGENVPFD